MLNFEFEMLAKTFESSYFTEFSAQVGMYLGAPCPPPKPPSTHCMSTPCTFSGFAPDKVQKSTPR